ncbi:KEOPS complex subunit [Candidatus Bathyarchaeota archaeon]|nr:MAG: KEOPS complex subunit [Candidatus Bathyarchaeota archaeon]
MEAEIILKYDNEKYAKAVANAVSPDNFKTPSNLSVKTLCSGKDVVTKIKCKGKLSTLLATIDDLLFCVSTAEKTLETAESFQKSNTNR